MSSGTRVVLLLVSAMVAVAVIASTAAASIGRPPDVRDTAASVGASAATLGSPPDVRDAAAGALERAAVAGLGAAPVTPPDVRDAAAATRVTALPTVSGFHWGDFAVGIGTGIGFALILAGFAAAVIARRRGLSTA